MKRLDQRGAAAFEFCIVAMTVFALLFAIFDFGRFAITMQSLRALANASARATMVSTCYSTSVTTNSSPSGCTGDYLTLAQKQAIAPMLYANGLTPTVTTTVAGSTLVVTASLPGFQMIFGSLWGTSLNAPSTFTKIPI